MNQILIIVFLPMLAAIIAGLGNKQLGNVAAKSITTGALFIACGLSWPIFLQFLNGSAEATVVPVMKWVASGTLNFDWALRVDTLTAVMLVVVTSVSALVHLYSWGYMDEEPDQPRFFAYLSLFTFAMLMLVTADNLVQMFFGWEGVGLASYLLIGLRFDTMTVLCLLLFVGAMGKSAQLGLHTWLPDAMEGPTPVSALIHAATMVTAGVFMVCRLSPMFETSPTAMAFITFIGAATCFFAATIGCTQWDIKRVIAYSTCSQLGYMFFAAGVGAFGSAMFHLFTHAFFKALLFLGSGSVIVAMHHEQDMRHLGGLRSKIPVTYAMMLIGTLALTGVGIPGTPFGFAGFFSKDAIIEAAYGVGGSAGFFAFWSLVIAAAFTSFYSWRLIHMTFHGPTRADHHTYEHAHESPNVMIWPLYVLAAGAVLAGVVFNDFFFGHAEHIAHFFAGSVTVNEGALEAAHAAPLWAKWSASVAMLLGFVVAWVMYITKPDLPARLAASQHGLYKFLLNKWYFDELY
ncbi:MAG: NADH-quinone oxidoreductase subunit L, partial [Novosphingobium sp.]